jgi:hypothetical protein
MIPTPTPLAGETTEGEAGCEDFFNSLLSGAEGLARVHFAQTGE